MILAGGLQFCRANAGSKAEKNSGFAVHLRGSFLCLIMLECFKVTNSWLCSSQQSNRWNRTDPINAWSCQSAGTPRAATIVLWLECVSVEFRPFPSTNPPNAACSPSMWTSYDRRRTFDRFLSDNCLRAVLQLIMLDDCLPLVDRRSGRRIRWIGPLNTTRKYLLVESWLKSSRTDAPSRLGGEGPLNVAFLLWLEYGTRCVKQLRISLLQLSCSINLDETASGLFYDNEVFIVLYS